MVTLWPFLLHVRGAPVAIIFSLLGILALIGWVWIMIYAFSDSVLWGIGIFCFSPLCLVYGFTKADELKVPMILFAVGFICAIIGRVMGS
jgi:uncharacterized membrane protein